jgi:hypothetical protein
MLAKAHTKKQGKRCRLQAGGAPNGGGNIDNKNMVTILEGLKLVRKPRL